MFDNKQEVLKRIKRPEETHGRGMMGVHNDPTNVCILRKKMRTVRTVLFGRIVPIPVSDSA